MSSYGIVKPIILRTYGDNPMAHALAQHLAERIDDYEGQTRERLIGDVCWNWFAGGSTAETVANKIEKALEAGG